MCSPSTSIRYRPPGRGSSSAPTPIHFTKRRLSVRKANTISGGASIRWVISIAPVRSSIMPSPPRAGFPFGKLLEPADVPHPHLPQDHLEWAQCQAIRPVEATGAGAAFDDKTRPLEDAEILGDRRPADVGGGSNLAGQAFPVPDQAQDLAASRTGDRVHRVLQGHWAGSSSHLHSWIDLFKLQFN